MNRLLYNWRKEAAKKVFLLLLLFCCLQAAQAQVFQWAKGFQSPGFFDYGNSLAVDANGNAYYAGAFENTLQLGSFSLNAPGYNLYIAKVDAAGNVQWAKNFPNDASFAEGTIYDLETDAAGNIYVTGSFEDSITVGNVGMATPYLGPDFFLTKISPGGTVLWAKHGSGDMNDEATSLSLDAGGNIYLTGYSYNIGFDFTYNGDTINGNGQGFLLKTDNNGELLWSKVLGGDFMEVAVDPTGDGYLTGSFSDVQIDFGNNITATHPGGGFYAGFLARFTSNGQFQWANLLEGPMTAAVRVKTDPSGNALALGIFQESFTYAGTSLAGQPAREDLFLIKVSDTGTLQWAKAMANMGWDQGFFSYGASPLLEVDAAGNSMVANVHHGTAQLDSAYFHFPHNDSTFDIALVKISDAGNLLWAERVGGAGWEMMSGMAVSASGNVYLSGGSEDTSGAGNPFTTTFGNNLTLAGVVQTNFLARLLTNANQITGRIFLDLNNSGTQDAGETGLQNIALSVSPGNMLVPSQAGGNYIAYTDSGSHSVTIPQNNTYYTLAPSVQTATFNGLGLTDSANHFALQPAGPAQDLQVSLAQLSAARPGFVYRTRIFYNNPGTVPMSGTVKMKSDTLLTFLNATPATSTVTADTLTWNFSALQPFETRFITVEWEVTDTAALGSQLRVMAMVDPITADLTPANNITEVTPTVTGSYDPNDKLVSHEELSLNQVADRQALTYMVRFQNTGTDTAFTVMVRDQLSQLLDMSTLEVISASHTFSTTFTGPNTIEWKFSNILLADSNTNEPASHGYVQYRIKPLATLTAGQHITTSANIYFDFNAPVPTNVTDTEVMMPVYAPEKAEVNSIQIWPNPTSGRLMVQFKEAVSGQVSINLYNSLGQLVKSENRVPVTGNNQLELSLKDQNPGVYLLQVQQNGKGYTKRVIIQK